MKNETQSVGLIEAKNLNISHGFFTRKGGVSINAVGEACDLNCGMLSGDDPAALASNRLRIQQKLGATALLSLNQVHSNKVVSVTPELLNNWSYGCEADALVCNMDGVAIGAMSADCGPVLFHDPVHKVVGAAHAGWNGAIGGILENTVKEMERLGAKAGNINAALGPCIQQASYQVGPEFYTQFCQKSEAYSTFFVSSDKQDYWQFDLAGFIVDRLGAMNLASVTSTGQDTCADAENFFSHRRGTISQKPDRMRHISAIKL